MDFDKEISALLQYEVLKNSSCVDREKIAQMKANAVRTVTDKELSSFVSKSSYDSNKNLNQLETTGFTSLGRVFSNNDVNDLVSYFQSRESYPSHIAASAKSQNIDPLPFTEWLALGKKFASYDLDTTLNAPGVLDLILDEKTTGLIEGYLDCTPTVYSANCWWTFPNGDSNSEPTLLFHRDPDDFKFLSLFVPLTKISPSSGGHDFLEKSHKFDSFIHLLRYESAAGELKLGDYETIYKLSRERDGNSEHLDYLLDNFFNNHIRRVYSEPGFGFLEDTWGLHRAAPTLIEPRLMLWIRYGLGHNASSYLNRHDLGTKMSIAEMNLRQQYMFRHFIEAECF